MADYYISLPVGVIGGITSVTGENYLTVAGSILTAHPINLSNTNVTGNLPVTHLNSGTGASNTTFWRGDGTWSAPTGTGTVTSVALSLPSIFSVSGSPVTTTGTLTGTLNTQTANTIFSGPSSGGAATPTFRALVAADIPSLSSLYVLKAGDTMTGALAINGSADAVQLLVKGNSTQTSLVFSVTNSSNANLLKVTNAGIVTAGGGFQVSTASYAAGLDVPFANTMILTTDVVALTIKGSGSQTANLLNIQSSGSVNRFSVSAAGAGVFASSLTAVTGLFENTANSVTLIVRRANGATSNIQEWQNSFSTVLASMNNSGGLVVQTLSSGTGLFSSSVQINNSADILSLRIKGFAGQSVDLFDMVDSSNNPIFAFGPTGIFNMFGGQQFNVAAILDGSSFSSLEPNARNAKDNTGQLAIDWQNRTLNDLSGNNQILFDNTGGPKIANKIIYYNGEATEGNGVPAIVGYFETIAHPDGGGISDVVYTTVSSGMYRVAVVFVITTAAAGGTFDLNLTWTSEVGGENIQIFDNALTTPARTVFDNTKATVAVNPVIIHCTAATDITISPDFTLIVGSLVYNMYVTVERLS